MNAHIQQQQIPITFRKTISYLELGKTSYAKCDRILENSSKAHMKSSVFPHVFNDISTYVYVFTEYFLHYFSNLSIEFLLVL